MVCVRKFCLCIPLEPACFAIGVCYITFNFIELIQYVDQFKKYEGRERKDESERVFFILNILFAAFEVLLGILIVFTTYKKFTLGLKICGCIMGLSVLVNFVVLLATPVLGKPIISYFLSLLVGLYLAVVVYSYGLALEDEALEEPEEFHGPASPQQLNPYSGQAPPPQPNPYSGQAPPPLPSTQQQTGQNLELGVAQRIANQ